MNKLLTLQDLETLIAKSNCACHFINPNKTRIILWKEEKDSQTTYYLRIGIQKFISYPLTDKNNEVYWRFKIWEGKVNSAEETQPKNQTITNPTNSSELDPITKFRQREAKVQLNHYGNSKTINHSESTESTSQ